MSVRNRLALLKKLTSFVGVASASVVIGLPAWAEVDSFISLQNKAFDAQAPIAQSSSGEGELPENPYGSDNELSPEQLNNFCERFPYNSLCTNNAAQPRVPQSGTDAPGSMNEPETLPLETETPDGTPEPGIPSLEMDTPDDMTEPGGLSPEMDTPDDMTEPGGLSPETGSPDEIKPDTSDPKALQ